MWYNIYRGTMKKLLIALTILLALTSCIDVRPSNKQCHTELQYRYGYNVFSGKFEFALMPTTVCTELEE